MSLREIIILSLIFFIVQGAFGKPKPFITYLSEKKKARTLENNYAGKSNLGSIFRLKNLLEKERKNALKEKKANVEDVLKKISVDSNVEIMKNDETASEIQTKPVRRALATNTTNGNSGAGSDDDYESWSCEVCNQSPDHTFCEWEDDWETVQACLPNVEDNYNTPCGSEPSDILITNCNHAYKEKEPEENEKLGNNWISLGRGQCSHSGRIKKVGRASSLEEAKEKFLSDPDCNFDDAILMYHWYSQSSWGFYCCSGNTAIESHANWRLYQLEKLDFACAENCLACDAPGTHDCGSCVDGYEMLDHDNDGYGECVPAEDVCNDNVGDVVIAQTFNSHYYSKYFKDCDSFVNTIGRGICGWPMEIVEYYLYVTPRRQQTDLTTIAEYCPLSCGICM